VNSLKDKVLEIPGKKASVFWTAVRSLRKKDE
jgi:hypothetical protein